MKLKTIQKYIDIMDSMIDSDYTSIKDYCKHVGINYNTFSVQMYNMRKLAAQYSEACQKAIAKYEEVKRYFSEKRYKNDSEENSYDSYRNKLLAEKEKINEELRKLNNLGQSKDDEENNVNKIDEDKLENYMDNIKLLN